MSEYRFQERRINPDRICDGISRIGYRPHAAIADIVDNSIAAHASKITVRIDIDDGSTLFEKNNVTRFTIIDNGKGMGSDEIGTALDLGSLVFYEDNSLSKYGLGLKSAGLSLGDRVVVLSKKDGVLTDQHALDRDVIRQEQTYGVCIGAPDDELTKFLEGFESGTVVQVQKTHSPQDSAGTVAKNLSERLGVIYYEFFKKDHEPLEIRLVYGNKEEVVEPVDIMFLDLARNGFDPDEYDGKTPVKVVDDQLAIYAADGAKRVVPVKVVLFPKDEMHRHVGFDGSEREQIKSYRVSRKNSGFFIYRNNRLIRWGDNLGIVSKDHYGFRARIDITSEHDDLLHVDVSKQNLILSEEFLDALKLKCRIPLSQMKESFKLCDQLKDGGGEAEGQAANATLEDLNEEDPEEATSSSSPETRKIRRKKAQADSRAQQARDGDESERQESLEFARVRYSENMRSTDLWSPENDPTYHTYVRINKNHQFYDLVLGRLKEGSQARIAIESFLYMLAVGENLTTENLSSVEYDDIKQVFGKFRRVISYNLEAWAARNQDLLG